MPPSIERETAKSLGSRARAFGVRASRIWSPITTHYLIDTIPEPKDGEPALHPLELLCGLLNGSNFVTTAWMNTLLDKAELPRGSGNLEERYDPPNVEDFAPSGTNAQLWQPSDDRQGLFKDVKFVVLYDGSEV